MRLRAHANGHPGVFLGQRADAQTIVAAMRNPAVYADEESLEPLDEYARQTLLVTALVYLNQDWKQGDGGEHKQRAQAPEAVEEEAGEGIGPAFGGVSKKMIQAGDLAADAGGEEGVVELADPGDGVSPGKAGAQALGGEEQVETGGVQGVGDAGEKEAGEQGERGNLAGGSGAELGPIDERSEGDHEPGRNESAEEAAKGERAEEGDGHAASVGGGGARLES